MLSGKCSTCRAKLPRQTIQNGLRGFDEATVAAHDQTGHLDVVAHDRVEIEGARATAGHGVAVGGHVRETRSGGFEVGRHLGQDRTGRGQLTRLDSAGADNFGDAVDVLAIRALVTGRVDQKAKSGEVDGGRR